MDDAYQAIAREVVNLCGAGFESARLSLETDKDFLSLALVCQLPGGGTETPRVAGRAASNIDDAVDDLKEAWPGPPFKGGVFHVQGDGAFRFDATYE